MGIPSGPAKQRLVTQQQYDQALAQFDAGHGVFEDRQSLMDSMIVPPPAPPDLSDQLVQARAMQVRRKLLAGGMTGPLDLTVGAAKAPGLTGT